MGNDRWQSSITERGKPRVYIQQYLDLKLPEEQYKQICKEMGLKKPFQEEAAASVMEAYLEDLGDGSQCESVHISRGDGLVVLMTVISYPYEQPLYERLLATHSANKAMS